MVKNPTTYEEQVEILKSRNIIVEDELSCIEYLSNLNYYRLTAYMLPFKISDDQYTATTFERICNLYEFDRRLRVLIMETIEEVELYVRTKVAYYHAHKYGSTGYLKQENFNERHKQEKFLKHIEDMVERNKKTIFVRHHIENKNGVFPVWVLTEIMSFGMLSIFFSDLKIADKKKIDAESFHVGYEQLTSWLHCLTILRNRCAHYMRLYYHNFNSMPKKEQNGFEISSSIFGYIYILKQCYPYKNKWNNNFYINLGNLIDEYENDIDLNHIGFQEDWELLIRN